MSKWRVLAFLATLAVILLYTGMVDVFVLCFLTMLFIATIVEAIIDYLEKKQ